MECCNTEIQISFSLPELAVVRRAVEKFAHVEISETRSRNQLGHAKNVIQTLNRKLHVCAAPERRSFNITDRAPSERLDASYIFSRDELEKIM